MAGLSKSRLGRLHDVLSGEGLVTVLLTQRLMESPQPPRWLTDFWTLASWSME
jgi:hypothetical protein